MLRATCQPTSAAGDAASTMSSSLIRIKSASFQGVHGGCTCRAGLCENLHFRLVKPSTSPVRLLRSVRNAECWEKPVDRVFMKFIFEYEDAKPDVHPVEPGACCDTTASGQGFGNIEHDVPVCKDQNLFSLQC
eukprot:2859778-Amphidinium_carterae.2